MTLKQKQSKDNQFNTQVTELFFKGVDLKFQSFADKLDFLFYFSLS